VQGQLVEKTISPLVRTPATLLVEVKLLGWLPKKRKGVSEMKLIDRKLWFYVLPLFGVFGQELVLKADEKGDNALKAVLDTWTQRQGVIKCFDFTYSGVEFTSLAFHELISRKAVKQGRINSSTTFEVNLRFVLG